MQAVGSKAASSVGRGFRSELRGWKAAPDTAPITGVGKAPYEPRSAPRDG